MTTAGKSAGRVSIRVVPDSTEFAPELRAQLEKIERSLKVQVQAVLDDGHLREQFDRLQQKLNGQKIELKTDLDSKLASLQVARIARNRSVDLAVKVNQASLAKAGTALAALSGGRAVGEGLRNVGTYLANLDRNIPKLAATSLAVANIGSAALSALPALLQVGGGLVTASGAAIALPGILTGGAVALATLSLALKDTGTQLAGLKPQLQAFQQSISGNFWDAAKKPIQDLAGTLLPSLQRQMGGVASALGGFTASLASSLSANLGGTKLDAPMKALADSITIAKAALDPLVAGLTALGTVGAQYLPGLAQAFSDISTQLGNFLQKAASDGSLKSFINAGLGQVKLLGSAIGSVAKILGGLFKAAGGAGGGGLAAFAGLLGSIASIVNGPAFQGALTTFFSGAAAGMAGLSKALGPIGGLFEALAPTIASVLGTAGSAVGGLLSSIASALAQPAFATGLTAFFDGISAGLQAVAPALPAVATALGALGGLAGSLAGTLGAVLGAALQALAPAITALAAGLTPLAPIIGQYLVQAVSSLAPLIASLVPAFLGIVQAIIPMLPALLQLVSTLATGLAPVIAQIAPLIAQLVPQISAFLSALIPVVAFVLKVAAGFLQLTVAGGGVSPMFQAVSTVANNLSSTWQRLASVGAQLVATLTGAVSRLLSSVVSAFSTIRTTISSAMSAATSLLTSAFERMVSAASSGVGKIISFVESIPGKARSALGSVASTLYGAGGDLVRGFLNGMSSMIGSVAARAAEMAHRAVAAAKSALGIHSPSAVFRDQVGKPMVDGMIVGLSARQGHLNDTIANLATIPPISGVAAARVSTDYSAADMTGSSGGRSLTFNGGVHGYSAHEIAAAVLQLITEQEALEPW